MAFDDPTGSWRAPAERGTASPAAAEAALARLLHPEERWQDLGRGRLQAEPALRTARERLRAAHLAATSARDEGLDHAAADDGAPWLEPLGD